MGALRKGIVGTVVVVLVLYFTLGLIGALPYEYDIVKKSFTSQSTQATVTKFNWSEQATINNGESAIVRDMISYGNSMYILNTKSDVFEIWKMSSTGHLELKDSKHFGLAIDFGKFIIYKDKNLNTVLYAVISGGVGTPSADFFGTYDGNSWQTGGNFVPSLINWHLDAMTITQNELFMGVHFSTSVSVLVWNSATWSFNHAKELNTYGKWVTAMATYTAPSPYNFTTTYLALQGDKLIGDASIYYQNSANNWVGVLSLQHDFETEVTAMHVFDNSLWFGTSVANIYSWNSATGGLYTKYSSPYIANQPVKALKDYKSTIYAGAWNYAQITKYTDNQWQNDYLTGQLRVNCFTTFNGKFYAGSGNAAKIYVYYENTVFGNPIITHSPVSEGYLGVPIQISATVSDSDGVDTVVLTYQQEGQIARAKTMGLDAGTGTQEDGKWIDGTYNAEITAINELTNVTYSITATDFDGNTTTTATYLIQIKENVQSFFGLPYWILYIIFILVTLIVGVILWGRDEHKGSWSKSKSHA